MLTVRLVWSLVCELGRKVVIMIGWSEVTKQIVSEREGGSKFTLFDCRKPMGYQEHA